MRTVVQSPTLSAPFMTRSIWAAAFLLSSCGTGDVRVPGEAQGNPDDGSAEELACDAEMPGTTRTRVRYASENVAYGETCSFEVQQQVCQDGAWTEWSGSFVHETCDVSPRVDCGEVPDGGVETRSCFDAATVPADGICTFTQQSRTCRGGTFDPDWPYCEFSSCTVADRQSCGSTPHGNSESRLCYTAATVTFGSTCSSTTQTRTCNNGEWDPDYGACLYLSCAVDPPGPHAWDVTTSPPALTNPETITLPGSYLGTTTHALCTGPGYNVYLDNTKDYIVRTTAILTAPVMIYGGRNVRVIGIHINLAAAPCASAGASGYAPGVIALKVYQVGTTFVEGAYIDVAGRSTDCIDPRNFIGGFEALSKGYSEVNARGARDVVIQNTVCRGMSGDVNVHGDVLQTQGAYEIFRNITFENVSADTNCEGTVLQPREGFALAKQITMRRFDYRMDARYTPNVVAGVVYDGGPIQHSAEAYSYDHVYISTNEPPYEMSASGGPSVRPCGVAGKPACDGSAGIYCLATPTFNRFASPGTGAATDTWTGVNYVSPH